MKFGALDHLWTLSHIFLSTIGNIGEIFNAMSKKKIANNASTHIGTLKQNKTNKKQIQ